MHQRRPIALALSAIACAAVPVMAQTNSLAATSAHIPRAAWIAAALLATGLLAYFAWRSLHVPQAAAPHRQPEPVVAAPLAARMRVPLELTAGDLEIFENLVHELNECWRSQNPEAFTAVATDAMAGKLARQLSAHQASAKNWQVYEIQVTRGELMQAWRDQRTEHAQMNMRLSTLESGDGEEPRQFVSRELWSFEREPGGRWRIAAVQSAE